MTSEPAQLELGTLPVTTSDFQVSFWSVVALSCDVMMDCYLVRTVHYYKYLYTISIGTCISISSDTVYSGFQLIDSTWSLEVLLICRLLDSCLWSA